MYLIRPDGKIVGRGLDTHALAQMLHMMFSDTKLEYGSKESSEFFSQIFAGGTPTQEQVKDVADMIAGSTLHKGDTVMFRQMTGDLLYYLSSERGSGYKEGLAYMIDKYILDPSVRAWHTADDSLKVIGFAQMMDDLLSKSAPGSRIADVKVPGVLLTKRGEHSKNLNLRKLRGRENVIIFHTEGCQVCKSEMMAARKLVQNDAKVKVFMVNIDDMILRFPSLAGRLFDTFDLTSLPYIIITDRKGNILGRYQSLL
jgi:thiol-disulfide isomerase/thioredoxin